MVKPILIREARLEDLWTIVEFQLAMAKETEDLDLHRDTVTQGVKHVFETRPAFGQYFVAELENQILGSLLRLSEWSDWRNAEVWWIHSVYVRPEFRRQGIYKLMYEVLKSLAVANHRVSGLRLYVEKHNQAAQRTYSSLGMASDRYDLFEWMKGPV